MRARQVLIFLLGVFALIGAGWLAFPAEGVPAGPVTLRFPSYAKMAAEAAEKKVDVDSVLTAVEERFHMHGDTLDYYRRFFTENPDRIYLPNDDYIHDSKQNHATCPPDSPDGIQSGHEPSLL